MCNASNHPPDCRCGWGGDGHAGQTIGGPVSTTARSDGFAVLSWDSASGLCRPTTCPECRQPVYFVRHNGGSVWFDELGHPWPVHGCFSKGWPRLKVRDYAVYERMGLEAPSGDALMKLLALEPGSRLGQVSTVFALGQRLRILSVNLPDGSDRFLVVEQAVASLKLAGAMVAYRDKAWLASVLVDRSIVAGWWLDERPGDWVATSESKLLQDGEIVLHPSEGLGAVLEVGSSGHKVKVVFMDGITKTYVPHLAKLQWLKRNKTYVPVRYIRPTPPAVRPAVPKVQPPAPPVPTVQTATPPPQHTASVRLKCPHCKWKGTKHTRHMKREHASLYAAEAQGVPPPPQPKRPTDLPPGAVQKPLPHIKSPQVLPQPKVQEFLVCPHCSWRGMKLARHLRRDHPDIAVDVSAVQVVHSMK